MRKNLGNKCPGICEGRIDKILDYFVKSLDTSFLCAYNNTTESSFIAFVSSAYQIYQSVLLHGLVLVSTGVLKLWKPSAVSRTA